MYRAKSGLYLANYNIIISRNPWLNQLNLKFMISTKTLATSRDECNVGLKPS